MALRERLASKAHIVRITMSMAKITATRILIITPFYPVPKTLKLYMSLTDAHKSQSHLENAFSVSSVTKRCPASHFSRGLNPA